MPFATLLPILLLALAVYLPGLAGPFFFDDYGTLPRLADFGGVDDASTALLFFAGDYTSQGGRPLALASFLLNAQAWPADPWAFKATNLALHLATGALLFVFCRQLLRGLPGAASRAGLAAALTAAFWLLNPLNVSTVLYVVQRMAQLAALAMLGGLVAYLHGRRLLATRPRRGRAWMTAAVLLFTPLAMLGKENGALLPVLILALECTVLRAGPDVPAAPGRDWRLALLWLPALLLLAALAHFAQFYGGRDFSLGERLLTEARVLFDYLWHWFNPFAMPRGVLADGYQVSRGLLSPPATLPAVAGILALGAWALWARQRHPLAALAILFYLAGHLMESTVLPLEIYFEHRNYLPAMLLALPPAAWLAQAPGRHRRLLLALVAAVLLALSFQTFRLARVWGDELALARWSLAANPASTRAYDNLAGVLTRQGRPDLAVALLEAGMRRHPGDSHFHLHRLVLRCGRAPLGAADWQALEAQFRRQPLNIRDMPLLAGLVAAAPAAGCGGDETARLLAIVDLHLDHPGRRGDTRLGAILQHLAGELHVKRGEVGEALAAFDASQRLRPDIGIGLQQVALLASHGHYRAGLERLARVERLPPLPGWKARLKHAYYLGEVDRLRRHLQDDLAAQEGRP